MPHEPEGLPGPDEISRMEVEVWQAREDFGHAMLQRDHDLALDSYRRITGDPEAVLPGHIENNDGWRSREDIDNLSRNGLSPEARTQELVNARDMAQNLIMNADVDDPAWANLLARFFSTE